jgi:hypothetical protein
MEVEGAKYLLLQGRDDMNDADVMLFLNNYADVDDDYEVNAESSYMTFGGLELTVLEGVMTQTSETDKGTIYSGIVRTFVAEDSLYVAFDLTMYAAPATVIELTDAMSCRCYTGGDGRTRLRQMKMTYRDVIAFVVMAIICSAIIVLNIYFKNVI